MAVWPTSLPQRFLAGGFTEGADDETLRSSVDVGPAKLRPRYTAEVKVFEGGMVLTAAQVSTLETFFTDTTSFGSLPFDWVHPRTLAAASLRFRGRPSYTSVGGNVWSVRLAVEMPP